MVNESVLNCITCLKHIISNNTIDSIIYGIVDIHNSDKQFNIQYDLLLRKKSLHTKIYGKVYLKTATTNRCFKVIHLLFHLLEYQTEQYQYDYL